MTMTTTMLLPMVVMVVMWVGGGCHQPSGMDTDICTPQQNNPGPGLPSLPESYSLRVEVNMLTKQQTVTLHEYYDYKDNIGAVRMRDSGADLMYFYLYNTNEYLQVTGDFMGGHYCYTQNLSSTDNNDMFGLKTNGSAEHIFSVKGALHYGGSGISQDYKGKKVVRGIPCNEWQSCQYWPNMNATSNVFWYFSDNDNWSSIAGMSIPVRCHISGTRWVNDTYSYMYEHMYEFYDFQADVTKTDTHFEVPRNTICWSEKNSKPLPTMPPAYSFDMENLDVNSNTLSFIREEYDSETKLMRFDYREPADSPFETRYISQYHDFNTGVAYMIDVMRANCTTTVIPQNGFDVVNVANGDVRFRDPNEFLDLNHPYVYQGVRNARGIDCDTWAVQRFDYPDPTGKNLPTIWTWYFATADWRKSMGFTDNLTMPVMLEIFGDNPQQKIHKHLSFYEYNVDEPDFLTWDISPCFGKDQYQNYAFLVKGRYSNVVQGDLTSFKYDVLASLQASLNIAPLRVSRLDVQEAGSNTLVTFDLLDKATLPGDVQRIQDEPDLHTALTSLNSKINAGTFKILVVPPGNPGNVQKLTVLPAGPQYQLQPSASAHHGAPPTFFAPVPSSSGYSPGSMGGMAVGMLVLGALSGFLIMFAIYKIRGGTFRGGDFAMKKFDNE